MASFQNSGSTPLDAIGLGNPADGAPGVTPTNAANYTVPNAAAIQSSITNAANQPVSVDQSGQNATRAQEEGLVGQEMQTANGQGPNPGNLQMQQGLQAAGAQSMGATQGQARGANGLAALRNQQNAQAGGQAQAIGQGAQTAANQQVQGQQAAAGLLGQIANGDISGASQRLQADITNRNLLQQSIQNQLQLSQQQLQGTVGFDQASTAYLMQQRQDYIQNMAQQQSNMRTFIGGVLQTAGTGAAAYFSQPGNNPLDPSGQGDTAWNNMSGTADFVHDIPDATSGAADAAGAAGDALTSTLSSAGTP